MSLSPTQVLKIYQVSKPTLYKDMKEGTVSFTTTDKGKRILQPAELDRVYKKKEEQGSSGGVNNRSGLTESDVNNVDTVPMSVFNEVIKQMKDQYEAQIENLQDTLKDAQQITLQIKGPENQKQEADNKAWNKTIEALEGQVTNERQLHQKELARSKRLHQEKKKLQAQIEVLKAKIKQLESRSVFGLGLFKKDTELELEQVS